MKVQNVTPLGDIPNNALIFLLSASDPNLFMSCTNLMPGEGKCKTILNTKSTEKYNQFRLIKHVDGSIALQNVSGRYLSCDRYWRNHDQTWESFSVNVATISKDKLTETIELISNYTHEKFTVDQNGTWSIRLAEAPTISLLSLKSTCISFRNESFNNLDSLTVDLVRSIYRATQEIGFFLAIGHRISMDLMPEIQDEVGKLPYKFDPENKKGYKENEMLMEAKHDELKYGNSRVISNSKERADLVHKYFLKCTRLSEDLLFLLAHAEEMVTGVVPHWKGVFTDVDKRYILIYYSYYFFILAIHSLIIITLGFLVYGVTNTFFLYIFKLNIFIICFHAMSNIIQALFNKRWIYFLYSLIIY